MSRQRIRQNVTRQLLALALVEKLGLPFKSCSLIVDSIFSVLIEELGQGNKIAFLHFGVFRVRHKGQRQGRNFVTGARAIICARRTVSFRASQKLRRQINRSNILSSHSQVEQS